jgi:hypothetical protein
MNFPRASLPTQLACIGLGFHLLLPIQGAEPSPGSTPKSASAELDRAAQALAEGNLASAGAGFDSLATNPAAPAFVRALALTGQAQTALARNDLPAALAAWRALASDPKVPPFHRAQAERALLEAARAGNGQPTRSPTEFREFLPDLPAATVTFHVSPRGSDDSDGSASRPFASPERARDAVRALRKSGNGHLPKGGVRVLFEAGDRPVSETFRLTSEDSGSPDAPVVYQARPGATVTWHGGDRITNWRPLRDPGVRARLAPGIADRVLEADLTALGTRDWGDATALRKRPELFANGQPQTLARWPNDGFVKTGEILGTNTFKVWNSIAGCKDGRFHFLEDRPATWIDEPDVRLYGYWFWDWYEEYQKVVSVGAGDKSFTLAEPYSVYGYRKDQRYFAVNVLRELDQPGEWYLDRTAARLYWLPPADLNPTTAEIVLSRLDTPFIQLENTRNVLLLGLTLHEARGDGIRISGGADCLVAGLTLRRLGGDAVVVEGGQHHGVFGCRMETLGCGGVRMDGGDRKSLQPGRHFVENCTVTDISRLKRTYTPAVHLDGCGNRIAHNRFENMPSSALRIEGNDHLIELNLVRDVVKESDDQGGVDMFGNPLYRGVVFRWNRWSDIRGGTHNGAAGIRLDDMISGVVIHGNLFERCGAVIFGGVQIHGGKDNLVDGNLFLDCFAGVSFSRWGEKRWLEAIAGFLPQAGQLPYATRYPQLADLRTGADINDLSRNLYVRCGKTYLRDGGLPRSVLTGIETNEFPMSTLEGADKVRSDPRLRSRLFEPIPISEIGPYDHPWRADSKPH